MTLPRLSFTDHGYLDASLQAATREAFYLNTDGSLKVHQGAQLTAWFGDDALTGGAWDFERGQWRGPAPMRVQPVNVRVSGATNDTSGVYPIAPVAASTLFDVLCELRITGQYDTILLEARLYNAATGAMVQTVNNITANQNGSTKLSFAGVAAGSYQLCVHVQNALQLPITAQFYTQLTGLALAVQYQYVEAGATYFWDYTRNLGRRPTDTTNSLYAKRAALELANQTLDRPEWAPYLVSGTPDEGEWSFLRIQSGGGSWAPGTAVFPNPGPALYKKSGSGATDWSGIAFDSMARVIGKAYVVRYGNGDDLSPGDQLIGGMLANENGPASALWKLHTDGTATLLGWNPDLSNGKCQCIKRNHSINGIKELKDGSIFCLSECSVMLYQPHAADVSQRLPGYPLGTDGEPGGYSLRVLDERINFFTENFFGSDVTAGAESNFYNRFQSFIDGHRDVLGPGTVWHGRECSVDFNNSLWGWSQDKPFSDPTAQQHLSRLSLGNWDISRTTSFPATLYNWRQLTVNQGKLIGCGVRPLTNTNPGDNPLWGVDNSNVFAEYALDYEPRFLSQTVNANGEDVLLLVARLVTGGAPDSVWHIVELTGEPLQACAFWDGTNHEFTWALTDLAAVGSDSTKWAAYLWWHADASRVVGGAWQPHSSAPTDSTVYLEKVTTVSTVSYHLHTGLTMPYDPVVWGELCLPVCDDGGACGDDYDPQPTCTDADCAHGAITGHWQIIECDTNGTVWESIQVSDINALDVNRERALAKQGKLYPNLWCRVDSSASQSDLTTYTIPLQWDVLQPLPVKAYSKVEVCVLWTDSISPVLMPAVDRR